MASLADSRTLSAWTWSGTRFFHLVHRFTINRADQRRKTAEVWHFPIRFTSLTPQSVKISVNSGFSSNIGAVCIKARFLVLFCGAIEIPFSKYLNEHSFLQKTCKEIGTVRSKPSGAFAFALLQMETSFGWVNLKAEGPRVTAQFHVDGSLSTARFEAPRIPRFPVMMSLC